MLSFAACTMFGIWAMRGMAVAHVDGLRQRRLRQQRINAFGDVVVVNARIVGEDIGVVGEPDFFLEFVLPNLESICRGAATISYSRFSWAIRSRALPSAQSMPQRALGETSSSLSS